MPVPDRLLKGDFGEGDSELELTSAAFHAHVFLRRALDNYGCAKYQPRVIRAKAYLAREEPTSKEVEGYIKEYIKLELWERWTGADNQEYISDRRWFRDNYFKSDTKPSTPRPPWLGNTITQHDWLAGPSQLFKKPQRSAETRRKPHGEGEGEKESEKGITYQETGKFGTDFFNYYMKVTSGKRPTQPQQDDAGRFYKTYGWKKLKDAMTAVLGSGYGWGIRGASIEKYIKGEWKSGGRAKPKVSRHRVDHD